MSYSNVLLVGATGMLGARIAEHLLDRDGIDLRLLVRKEARSDPEKARKLDPLVKRGAEIVEGDVSDPASLERATEGVEVVVSAVQGGHDVIVDGQVALARAGANNGVRRILPSDYAVDFFKVKPGDHPTLDLRYEADKHIAEFDIEQVNMLNGAFLDAIASPGAMIRLDEAAGTASFWGSGHQPFDATTVDDTARFAARAAVDPDIRGGKFAVAAQQLTMTDLVHHAEQINGRSYQPISYGSVDDLHAFLNAQREQGNGDSVIWAAYLLYMLGGQTRLDDLQNERYPDIKLTTLDQLNG